MNPVERLRKEAAWYREEAELGGEDMELQACRDIADEIDRAIAVIEVAQEWEKVVTDLRVPKKRVWATQDRLLETIAHWTGRRAPMLTHDEVTALSGCELDYAVAEHVFKWQRWDHFEDQAETRPITEFIRPGHRYPVRASAYSTSYDAMGVLIERMTAQGWNMYIEGGYENEFQCGFSRVPDGEINDEDIVWFYAKGCTAAQAVSEIPEAVARAALLAVGEEMHRDLQAPL